MFNECPVSVKGHRTIQLAHGGGGRLMNDLLRDFVLPLLDMPSDQPAHDGAYVTVGNERLAFTTDSYVVKPLFFPGGDIGSLAVNGTINDLAMCGARPLWLSCGLIIEEGFPLDQLERVLKSLGRHAKEAGVRIVTGDTKVVDKGKGDGIFINTSGVGLISHAYQISPAAICSGDVLIVSGDLGRHGIAVMGAREGIAFEHTIESDTTPLHWMVNSLLEQGFPIHCLRDLTRGGLASVLIELAEGAKLGIRLNEPAVAVAPGVRGACEILGLDPLYLANEGRFVCVVAAPYADKVVQIMRLRPEGAGAAIIGIVTTVHPGTVTLVNQLGTERFLPMLSGEQMPRIC